MCGIAGCVGSDPGTVDGAARTISRELGHRGPDDQGQVLIGRGVDALACPDRDLLVADVQPVALANRRLAILDRSSAGHQPFVLERGPYALTYNGEVYNYVELRAELEALGHVFRSHTDTEVVLRGYAEWGTAVLARLIGMFSFALYDGPHRRLVLARDPFGMKPLYMLRAAPGFCFASELSALAPVAGWNRALNPAAVSDYLDGRGTDYPGRTFFSEVSALPPGCFLTVPLDGGSASDPTPYWSPPDPRDRGTVELSLADAARELRDRFLKTIEWHLRSDVPIGTLLSGGVDSSAVVMGIREVAGANADIHTFSYRGGAGGFDESRWIDEVNRRAGAIAHSVDPLPADLLQDRLAYAAALDEPVPSLAVYYQYQLFRSAREAGVPVILDGQGADELLGGYRSAWSARLGSTLARGRLPSVVKFLVQVGRSRSARDPTPMQVLRRAVRKVSPDALHRQLRRAVRLGLPQLLRFEDRAAMAHGVECRLPFLSTDLAEFVMRLPASYIVSDHGVSKCVFRAAMRGIVPDSVLDRPEKVGFAVPSREWMAPGTPLHTATLDAVRHLPRNRQPPAPGDHRALWRCLGLAAWGQVFDVVWD